MSSVPNGRHESQPRAAALRYARLGWHVVPLHTIIDDKCSCEKPDCIKSAGKHPLTKHGLKEATTDEATILRWWAEAPQANVGIATGAASGVFMVGPDGPAGIDALAALEACHGPLPVTPRARSGGGGRHYYFACPADGAIGNKANHRGLPIDVRDEGGLVVAPPSLHLTGGRYEWEVAPGEVKPATAPAWLLEWLRNGKGTSGAKDKPDAASGKVVLTVGPDGGAGVRERAIAYLAKCDGAVSGQGGHGQTFEVARAVVYGFGLGPDVGYELLATYYNPRCVPPWSERELRHKCQEADTRPFDSPRGYLLGEAPATLGISSFVRPPLPSDGDIEALPMPAPPPWPTLAPEALHGLAGEVVGAIAPETESAPVAILGQLLVGFGNAVGRGPHFEVEGDTHHVNLFLCLVGKSSHGRKGTSRGRVMQLMQHADSDWCKSCVASGLSSGEGLIAAVRDPTERLEPVKAKGKVSGYQKVLADEGVTDKRLCVTESEFAQALRVMQREGNTLSPVVRQAWDTGDLRTLTKNSPLRATAAHISIVGHITQPELAKYLSDTELFNGFANRFGWLCVRRAQVLPDGGRALALSPLGLKLKRALVIARTVGLMARDTGAAKLWRAVYPQLTAERSGLYGAVTGRAEAQVLRLSMVYALLDGNNVITEAHLHAALAFWGYADESARLIFGGEAEDPLVGLVLAKLREAPHGLTRTQLSNAFSRNVESAKLLAALATLRDRGEAYAERERAGKPGAPAERWRAGRKGQPASPPLPSAPTVERTNEPIAGASSCGEEAGVNSFVRPADAECGKDGEEVVTV